MKMENINREFFDEYTKLDNLCRQMFNSERGVSSYIEAMESTPSSKSRNVPEWGSDLKMLKQYRHIRNELAHSTGAFHRDICFSYDITWIKMFYNRIIKRKDPLGVLFSISKKGGSQKKNTIAKRSVNVKGKSKKKTGKKIDKKAVVLGFIMIMIAIILINYFT